MSFGGIKAKLPDRLVQGWDKKHKNSTCLFQKTSDKYLMQNSTARIDSIVKIEVLYVCNISKSNINLKQPCNEVDLRGEEVAFLSSHPFSLADTSTFILYTFRFADA